MIIFMRNKEKLRAFHNLISFYKCMVICHHKTEETDRKRRKRMGERRKGTGKRGKGWEKGGHEWET